MWSREDKLSPRDRSMVTIAALFSAGLYPQLKSHLAIGKEHGVTKTEIEEKTPSFRFDYSTARGEPFAGSTQRGSDACPLHLLCKCGVPACRLHAVEQLTLAVAPVNYWRKGLLRFWLAAGFIPDLFCSL